MSRVALVRCEAYEINQVRQAVDKGIMLLGGWDKICKAGEKILLKPNLLAPAPPEKCVTTHPAVFRAMAEGLQSQGVLLSFGDSPAFGSPQNVAKKAGILEAAQEMNIELANFTEGDRVSFPDGYQNKSFVIAKGVLNADAIISLSKLKTHGLTTMTGAIKNQFGCIPGVLKGEYHVKLPDLTQFATMLVDLNRLLQPRLYVMDGIIGMEGNGPRGGKPRPMNLLLFSDDPVALDTIVCLILGINPNKIEPIQVGKKLGLGEADINNIEIVGDELSSFIQRDFKAGRPSTMMKIQSKGLRNKLVAKPVIIGDKCIACGVCSQMCPVKPKAVQLSDNNTSKLPIYNYNHCIRCYCCQELCPEGAIELGKPFLGRILERFAR